MIDQPLLTVEEVAELLRVSVGTVKNEVERGVLYAVRIGGRGQYRFQRDEVQRYMQASMTGPPGEAKT